MQNSIKDNFIMIFKGVFLCLIVALVGVLIFSAVVKLATLATGVIKPVNQFIKVLAIFLGCFFSLKGNMGFLKGCLLGVLGTVLIYLVFSLIGGELSFGFAFILDLLFGGAVGLLSGIIAVNLKR